MLLKIKTNVPDEFESSVFQLTRGDRGQVLPADEIS